MYRIIILLSLICAVTPHQVFMRHCCNGSHHYQDYRLRHRDRTFKHLAKQVIDLDKRTRELCTENSNNRTVEDYSGNDYKLTVNLPEYKEEEITVKLKYRVLYINAEKEEDSELKVYFEVRVIPEVADLKNASWDFTDGKLEITFPYKEKSKNVATCDCDFDDDVKIVSKYFPKLDIRIAVAVDGSKLAHTEAKDDCKENKVKSGSLATTPVAVAWRKSKSK